MLKDHADFLSRFPQLALAAFGDGDSVHRHPARRGLLQAVEQAQERALSGAAVADDAEDLPAFDFQMNILEGNHVSVLRRAVHFAHMIQYDHRFHHPLTKKSLPARAERDLISKIASLICQNRWALQELAPFPRMAADGCRVSSGQSLHLSG